MQIDLLDMVLAAEGRHKVELESEVSLRLANSLYTLCETAIDKFVKGQKEHGGDVTDRNLYEERKNEIIDLFFYNEAEKWK